MYRHNFIVISAYRFQSKLDELKKANTEFITQIEITKESVSNNQKYITENIVQNPVEELIKSSMNCLNVQKFDEIELTNSDVKSFQNEYKHVKQFILTNFGMQYDHNIHTSEYEELSNLTNSVFNIQAPFTELWDTLSLTLTGKLPADQGSIDESEINRKVVQLQMMVDTISKMKQ